MKKQYTAPGIVFESFSLSVSIAASCAVETNATKGSCGYDMGWNMFVFFEGIDACHIKIAEDGDLNNTICYHNPTEESRLFSS